MTPNTSVPSVYLQFYQYLPVLDAEQIRKLRKIAIGILDISAFSEEEISLLDLKLHMQTGKDNNLR